MENTINKNLPIGFMDSGLGGLSVLREAVRLLPNEDFIYYGDSLNAPYGTKKSDEIKRLTFNVAEKLFDMRIKALVVACNTATGAAIDDLREKYRNIPIIGIEPAIKPAVVCNQGGRIIVMATSATVSQTKFLDILELYKDEAKIVPIGCDGLMEFVEHGNFDQKILNGYLENRIRPYITDDTESIVLGCTHYPFIKAQIREYIGNSNIRLIDGSKGTSSQLKRQLKKANLLTDRITSGKITILNSSDDAGYIERSWRLLNLPID